MYISRRPTPHTARLTPQPITKQQMQRVRYAVLDFQDYAPQVAYQLIRMMIDVEQKESTHDNNTQR